MTTYGPPTAQEHLREAMRVSTDPRWVERQLWNDYEDPGPDIIERRWPLLWSVIGAMLAGAAMWLCIIWALGWLAVANAAENADHMRPHEITLLLPPDLERPGIITISAAYPDRAACEKAKQRVTVKAPGGKLVCGIVNPWRVR